MNVIVFSPLIKDFLSKNFAAASTSNLRMFSSSTGAVPARWLIAFERAWIRICGNSPFSLEFDDGAKSNESWTALFNSRQNVVPKEGLKLRFRIREVKKLSPPNLLTTWALSRSTSGLPFALFRGFFAGVRSSSSSDVSASSCFKEVKGEKEGGGDQDSVLNQNARKAQPLIPIWVRVASVKNSSCVSFPQYFSQLVHSASVHRWLRRAERSVALRIRRLTLKRRLTSLWNHCLSRRNLPYNNAIFSC